MREYCVALLWLHSNMNPIKPHAIHLFFFTHLGRLKCALSITIMSGANIINVHTPLTRCCNIVLSFFFANTKCQISQNKSRATDISRAPCILLSKSLPSSRALMLPVHDVYLTLVVWWRIYTNLGCSFFSRRPWQTTALLPWRLTKPVIIRTADLSLFMRLE